MSMSGRFEVLQRLRRRYGRAGVEFRHRLVSELCSVAGYERKYAIKLLNGSRPGPRGRPRGGSQRLYGQAEAEVARAIWRWADYPCGKRLVAMLPLWRPAYEAHCGALPIEVRQKLERISAPTLDRLLAPHRLKLQRPHGGTQPGRLLRNQIPVRCESWDIERPGYLEADTVDHGGTSTEGDFMRSITYTDIYSGWTEQAAIWNKSAAEVLKQTRQIEGQLPFPLLGFDSDNGGEFLNHALCRYFRCRGRPIEFTRSRSYHKNDNAHVEQKNWTKVRQLLGYARYDQPQLVDLVQTLYRNEWRLLQNFFHPTMKLQKKERHGSRVKKTYDRPQTPAQRLLAWQPLAPQQRTWLSQLQTTLDPIALSEAVNRRLQQIRRVLREGSRHVA